MIGACFTNTNQGWVVRKHFFKVTETVQHELRFKCETCGEKIKINRFYWLFLMTVQGARFDPRSDFVR